MHWFSKPKIIQLMQNLWGGFLACAGTTAMAFLLLNHLDLANIVMLFLLTVVLVALKGGKVVAAWTSLLNVLAFNYFFVPPRFSFDVDDAQYLVTFMVMLFVGLVTGQITAGLKYQAELASAREKKALSLYEFTRDLSAASNKQEIVRLGESIVSSACQGQALLVLGDSKSGLLLETLPPEIDRGVLTWVIEHRQAAGLGTPNSSKAKWQYLPMVSNLNTLGVLLIKPGDANFFDSIDEVRQLDNLVRQIALALERAHYVKQAWGAQVMVETEKMRNTLLASVSHDLRTPMTVLIGLAETVKDSKPPLSFEQSDMVDQIVIKGHELNHMMTNILELARHQSGQIQLRKQMQEVEEIVGASIRHASYFLKGDKIRTTIPMDLPAVCFDGLMIERVLVNLIENACRHGAPGFEIRAGLEKTGVFISVLDQGAGLPSLAGDDEQGLFAPFVKGNAETSVPGFGMGLALCQAIMKAHQGSISAATRPEGGAEFRIWLPIAQE